MRIVTVNYYYDRHHQSAESLLDRYHTLTGWAEAIAGAGVDVTVVQRFSRDETFERAGITYRFVSDPCPRFGTAIDYARRVNAVVKSLRPDVVHVHGLRFARQAARLKSSGAKILLQDHADQPPRRMRDRLGVRQAMNAVDALSFAARSQSRPWKATGLIDRIPIYELMEGSSHFHLRRPEHGLTFTDGPTCLWVGRLNANKDPLTVLQGFEIARKQIPGARLIMAYGESDLLPAVQEWLGSRPTPADAVTLLGEVPRDQMEALYNSVDFLVLGSHHEGSGYAVLEALACGVEPVVTDIPSFRRLLGDGKVGGLWPVGDAGAMATELLKCYTQWYPGTPQAIRRYFECQWSYEATGRQAVAVYRDVVERTAP